jgi:hypothetical protein
MDVAALIVWIITAAGGFYLLGTWITRGGARRGGSGSKFPPALIFGHFLLAAIGLVLWIVYVAADKKGIGWTAFGLLAVVALLGFTMFGRWLPTYRSTRRAATAAHAREATAPPASQATTATGPAERHFPVAIVLGHGVLAATTLVLVIVALVGVGGS